MEGEGKVEAAEFYLLLIHVRDGLLQQRQPRSRAALKPRRNGGAERSRKASDVGFAAPASILTMPDFSVKL